MDDAYTDKVDGKISEDFRGRELGIGGWKTLGQDGLQGLNDAETSDRALDAQRIVEFDLFTARRPPQVLGGPLAALPQRIRGDLPRSITCN
jgi:hypothetical protein